MTDAERRLFPDADPERPYFPEAKVALSGQDGSTPAIIARVSRALRRAGATGTQLEVFRAEALSGDYDHMIQTCMRWAEVG